MNKEIISDIRNKLQAPFLVFERMLDGKSVPEDFIDRAVDDLSQAEKLFQSLLADGNQS